MHGNDTPGSCGNRRPNPPPDATGLRQHPGKTGDSPGGRNFILPPQRELLAQRRDRQHGVTLIELMIALTLGLIITGAAIAVMIGTSRSFRTDTALARVQENARVAVRALAQDLSLADFWGELLDPAAIDRGELHIIPANDCGVTPEWAISPQPAVESLILGSDTEIETRYPCIRSSDVAGGTDILVVKRVEGDRRSSERSDPDDDGTVFLRTDNETGTLISYDHAQGPSAGDPTAPGPGISDWRWITHVYYIRNESVVGLDDGIPTLYRKRLTGLKMREDPGGVAPGIEYFHVMWGIDSDGDGVPDRYQARPADTAVTVRIHLLARALDPDPAYVNDRIYTLGTDADGNPIRFDFRAQPDHFRRRVFVTTVRLANRAYRQVLQSGGRP